MVASRLQALEKIEAEQTNRQPRGRMLKSVQICGPAVIAVLLTAMLSLGAAFSTKLILSLWGQPVAFGRLFSSLAANIALGYVISWALGRLFKGAKVAGFLGGVSGITLVIAINGWHVGIAAVLMLGFLVVLLAKLVPFGKKA
jgi:hypothetical protein